jgi:hypothetical protein
MKRYELNCLEWDATHVKFNVFDPQGANCGTLTILVSDVVNFVKHSWNGDISWNNKMPDRVVDMNLLREALLDDSEGIG